MNNQIPNSENSQKVYELSSANTKEQEQKKYIIDIANSNFNIRESTSQETLKQNQKQLLYLTICFITLYSAYNPIQNLCTQIYSQLNFTNLAQYQLFAIYLSYGGSSIFASYFVNKYGVKPCLVLGTITVGLFVYSGNLVANCTGSSTGICQIPIIYSVVIISALLCGLGSSILWLGNSAYIDSLAAKAPDYRGRYYGFFFGVFNLQAFIGIGLSTLLLSVFSKQAFYIVMSIIVTIAVILILQIQDVKVIEKQSSIKQSLINKGKEQNDEQNQQEENSLSNSLRQFIKFIKIEEMQIAAHFFTLSGLCLAVYCGFMHILVEHAINLPDTEQNQKITNLKTTLTFLALGAAEIFGAYISGKLSDANKEMTYFLCNIGSNIGTLAMMSAVFTYYMRSYFLCFVTISLLGLAEFFGNTLTSVIITDDYHGRLEGFMIYRVFGPFSSILILSIQLLLSSQPAWIYMVICIMASLYLNVKAFQLRKPQKHTQVKSP